MTDKEEQQIAKYENQHFTKQHVEITKKLAGRFTDYQVQVDGTWILTVSVSPWGHVTIVPASGQAIRIFEETKK